MKQQHLIYIYTYIYIYIYFFLLPQKFKVTSSQSQHLLLLRLTLRVVPLLLLSAVLNPTHTRLVTWVIAIFYVQFKTIRT